MLVQALLVAAWAGICFLEERSIWIGLNKPLIAASVVGIILGDFQQAVIIGGTLELMWMGTVHVGAYVPPNITSGAIIGTAIAIISGGGIATGIAVAIPASIVVQQILVLAMTLNIGVLHIADKRAETGDFMKVARTHWYAIPAIFLAGFVPAFAAVYFGGNAAEQLIAFVPEAVMTGLSVASGIIPAVGMAMLMTMMMKKNMWLFFVLSFTLAAYLDLGTIPLVLIGIVFAFLYDMIISKNKGVQIAEAAVVLEDGGYDL